MKLIKLMLFSLIFMSSQMFFESIECSRQARFRICLDKYGLANIISYKIEEVGVTFFRHPLYAYNFSPEFEKLMNIWVAFIGKFYKNDKIIDFIGEKMIDSICIPFTNTGEFSKLNDSTKSCSEIVKNCSDTFVQAEIIGNKLLKDSSSASHGIIKSTLDDMDKLYDQYLKNTLNKDLQIQGLF
ncbi:uncharacterized protein LOC126899695 [Daktulosphaira vitifoliae]|uniref:uncharacterized protein LOC126899695 n=1 Tax=Daktulosphaira vitifoliae TaxID=58002 RepID=UPI0021AA998F|nr:uncharacterized protein LOC126899695 [Daktulosphaira vitifoliae]